jgi:threonine dehydrogenase-like Zn-dependent dehydrogenase
VSVQAYVGNLPVAACKGKGEGRWEKTASEGHEINGEVGEIGSDVLHVKKGDIVSVLDERDSFRRVNRVHICCRDV